MMQAVAMMMGHSNDFELLRPEKILKIWEKAFHS
jgi:hypothetical protein